MNEINFDDLEDKAEWENAEVAPVAATVEIPGFVENCPKCRGTGQWRPGYRCFKCKGKGKLTFKTSPELRSKGRKSAAKSQARKADEKAQEFLEWLDTVTDVRDWIIPKCAAGNSWAQSMYQGGLKYSALTDNMVAAIRKAIADDEDRMEQAKTGIQLVTAPITDAFNAAVKSGLKKPTLTIGILQISRAPDTGKNPGMLYIKSNGQYIGKVTPDGQFLKSFACSATDVERLQDLGANFLEEAVAHGKRTGHCACCNRLLVDPVSVERGIGPICADKWGL